MRITAGICLIFLGLLLLAYGLSLSLSPAIFQSTVRLRVEKDMQDVGSFLPSGNIPFDPYWVQTEFEKIQSKTILYPVISNLQLHVKWSAKHKKDVPLRIDEAYVQLKQILEVRQARDSALITITVSSEDRNEAATIANAIAEEYRDNRIALKRERSLAPMRNEYAKKEERLRKLEAQAQQPSALTKTNEVQMEIGQLKNEIQQLHYSILDYAISLRRTGTVQILDRAEPSRKPAYPNKIKMGAVFLAGILSLLSGLLLLKARC